VSEILHRPNLDTPYGRIGLSVCREIDMAKYQVQAGRQNVDIMISRHMSGQQILLYILAI
jgi:hypothetical protein